MEQMSHSRGLRRKYVPGAGIHAPGVQPTYLLINKTALSATSSAAGGASVAKTFVKHKDAHNERAQRQDEIERRLVAQLGDRYRDARLVEVSEGSYLIQNRIRLPIFGSSVTRVARTKSSISKRDYLLNL
jgi:hypothetical protein